MLDAYLRKIALTEKPKYLHYIMLWGAALIGLCASPSHADVLLECKLKGGYPDVKLYINEQDGYILYNAQLRKTYERKRTYKGESGPIVVDEGLDITVNNSKFIQAHDDNSSIVIVKSDASFAYAWTTPVPLPSGKFLAFGNNTSGTCSTNPFSEHTK